MKDTNKEKILEKMDKELELIAKGNYELRSGESFMTAESAHYAIRQWFLEEHIPEHIAGLMVNQEEPLERMYEFYVDSACLTKEVEGKHFFKDYMTWLYNDHLRNSLHDKVEKEYQNFIEEFKKKPPYNIPKLMTEMTVKMQVYSLFRYNDPCDFTEKCLENLCSIENILDKVYKATNLENLARDDLECLEENLIHCLLHISTRSADSQELEENGYEMD